MKKTITYSLTFLLLIISNLFISCGSDENAKSATKNTIIDTGEKTTSTSVDVSQSNKHSQLTAILNSVIGGNIGDIINKKMDKQTSEIKKALPGAKIERIGEGVLLTLGENLIKFNTNKFNLTPDAQRTLNKLIPIINSHDNTNIIIYGYTDNTGIIQHKRTLSAERAGSIRTYLIGQGIRDTRIKTKGLGVFDPIASNQTEEGRSKNIRIEFAILASDKMIKEAKEEVGQ